jgi:hypothetical protein
MALGLRTVACDLVEIPVNMLIVVRASSTVGVALANPIVCVAQSR